MNRHKHPTKAQKAATRSGQHAVCFKTRSQNSMLKTATG
jgi:hypothetical protein